MGMTLDSRRGFGIKLAAVGAAGLTSMASAGEVHYGQLRGADHFRQSIGKRFTVTSEHQTLVVELREVHETLKRNDLARPSSLPRRRSVSLFFSPINRRKKLEPVYQLDHRTFGGTSIALMPVGPTHDLEAVLN